MTQAAKAQEPSMEEILASIRRIIADDDATKPAKTPEAALAAKQQPAVTAAPSRPTPPPPAPAKTTAPPPAPKPAPVPANAAANSQDDIDAMLAELEDAPADEQASTPDVFDLTESMAAPAPPPPPSSLPKQAPGFRTIDGTSDVVFTTRPEPPPHFDRGLISNETVAAVDSAFNSLAHTIIGQNARTLEDLVKEMMRPMLKSWLDDNLPSLVERIVRAEIERVSRGR